MPPLEWPWDAITLSALATHLGRNWIYRLTPRVAVELDVAPWTAITIPGWQKTELVVAPRGRHAATGENNALYLRRVQRFLFNPEGRRTPVSITFVAGKNQVTVFGDGTYVGGSSADVPEGEVQGASRPRLVSEDAAWASALQGLYDEGHRLIA